MRAKSLALLAVALGCGLVASLGITQVLGKRAENTRADETQEVFVAIKDIPLGTMLNADWVKSEAWPKPKVPTGAITARDEVEGHRLRTKLYAGEPVIEQKLFGKGASDQGVDALIPKGYRVISVGVDPTTINGGLVLPGSRVDIQLYVTKNPAIGVMEATTRTILQDIKVFAVNDVISPDAKGETKSIQGRTVSLLVTPIEAQKITLASNLGMLRLSMRNPEDDEHPNTASVMPQDIFGDGEHGNRQRETLMAEPAPPKESKQLDNHLKSIGDKVAAASTPAEPGRWTMRVIRATEVNDVELEEADPATAGNGVWRKAGEKTTAGSIAQPAGDAPKAEPERKAAGAAQPAGKPAAEEPKRNVQ
jgi:pilus assembly protein CpaB